jgi:hypothetical protein
MRRSAQFLLETGAARLQPEHVDSALDEMLFHGGSLNAKLLGGMGVPRPKLVAAPLQSMPRQRPAGS